MRTYEFTPTEDTRTTLFAIRIADDVEPKVSTEWRDYDRNLYRAQTEPESQKFVRQLARFWKTVCSIERKYKSGMVEKILESIADPDLKQFLLQYS